MVGACFVETVVYEVGSEYCTVVYSIVVKGTRVYQVV